jgi:hypothetical protein
MTSQNTPNAIDLLTVFEFNNKIRLGNLSDGGYVIGELNELISYDCYISAGVSNEESFSRDFIERYNMNEYNSFAFDGTINVYPYSYTNKISFIKKNISYYNNCYNTNLSYLIEKYKNIFLKMDIEGAEFNWIYSLNISQLCKFKQIVIEFHGITDDTWGFYFNDKIKCLEKLTHTHYLIHAHGNNYSYSNNNIPNVIELTYINKKYFNYIQPNLNTTKLPINNLDYPNNKDYLDYNLDFYPFVNKK